jgi:asparagine synthetase B (glutamine-hydrolysing)
MGDFHLSMCGICGFLDLQGQPVDEAAGQRVIDLLWHRGPEGCSVACREASC